VGNCTQCLGRVLQKIDVEMSFHGCLYLGGRLRKLANKTPK
jgi:hypothetical protein